MNDTEWFSLLKKSPQKAHAVLIDKYGNLVYAIVLDKLRNCAGREELEDCVSDVFVEVFRNTDKFDESKGSLKGFISIIAKRTAINAFQRLTYRRNITSSIEEEGTELPPCNDTPETETHDKMFRSRLWEIVESLGEPDSSILVYQYFYEMKVSDIAEKLSMSAAAIQKRSIRARERIKKILEKENLA